MEKRGEYQFGGIVPPRDSFRAISVDGILLRPPTADTLDWETLVRIDENASMLQQTCQSVITSNRSIENLDVNNIRSLCLRLYELAFMPEELTADLRESQPPREGTS